MALIKFGMMMTDARGKLGGQVFTKTRSGATVRTKVTPTNPQTAAQQVARAVLGSLSSAWRALSVVERASWNAAVDSFSRTNIFGDSYLPSGKNLFVGLNANLQGLALPTNETAPASRDVPAVILRTASVDIAGEKITLATIGALPGVGLTIVYQATKPASAGRYNFSGAYATFANGPGTAINAPALLYTEYIEKFGVPPVGQKISFRAFVIANDSGQKSVESVVDAIVE